MKSRLLMGTALLALVVGTASAGAQTAADPNNRNQTNAQDRNGKPVRVIDTKRPNDNSQAQAPGAANGNATTTTGAATTAPAQQSTPANQSGSSSSSQNSTANQPSTAQSGQTSPSSQSNTSQSNTAQSPASSTSTNTANDNKTNTNQPASAQTTQPAAQQPSTASGAAPAQPNTAQQNAPAANPSATNNGQAQVRLSATLQAEQKTKLTQAFTKVDMKPVTNVNFSLTVGSTVPRTVEFRPLPASVVAIIPQYRGYNYTLVRDEIVIIEPGTSRIVDVIERSGPSRASTTTTSKSSVNLSKQQRDYIREHSTRRTTVTTTGSAPRTTTRRVVVGDTVPDTVEIESFPEEVYREVPTVRSYRYIRGDRGIYLVDPDRRVVIDDLDD